MKKQMLWALFALALAGCGGDANTGSNGTGQNPPPTDPTVASGPITGLGPLGVAGTQLNDAGTQVLLNASAARPASDLRLGMFADAEGVVAPSNGTGFATTSVAQSTVLGPVTSIDPSARTLQVMGLPVRVDANTLLDGIERLDQLAVNDWVEVYGLRLPAQDGTLATRLIAHRVPQDRSVEVLGSVSDFSAGPPIVAASGLRIDYANAQISTASPAGVSIVPPGVASLSPGALVRIRGTYDQASGTVTATSLTTGIAPVRPEGKLVYVEGIVTAQISTRYAVGDLFVDTTVLGIPLTVGSRVRLRGRMVSGTVRVDHVVEIAPGTLIEYVVEGPIATFNSPSDFTVRGERIDASQAVVSGGGVALIGPGVRVRVKGVAGPGRINATEVVVVG
jgi:hypothetical protein